MKEIDGVLNEMAIMLGRWSLYCRFLADTCNVSCNLCLCNTNTNNFTSLLMRMK
jgi:COG4 transport protein.